MKVSFTGINNVSVYKDSNPKEVYFRLEDGIRRTAPAKYYGIVVTCDLTDDEKELSCRARNLPIPVGRRSIQHDYRLATAFEALIGWWYLNDKERYDYILGVIQQSDFFN